ncbi:TCR/Tet family MFS transporter [Rubripirellula sp.]|nr:TCR/Tet family MFS transporter [Planctomycetaceae bacterium]MDA9857219.1 TCR/Tet family MFS transporter [Rubripirellula sp.]
MTQAPGNRRQAAIAFILVTLFIDILGIGIIVPVLPELVKEFVSAETTDLGISPDVTPEASQDLASAETSAVEQQTFSRAGRYVGVIGASYALMQFLFAPIMGALSDRFGRRPVILISLFGLGVDFLIQGLAPNIWWLFLGRIFAGIMGANFTTANAYIADVSTDETRARNFGFVGMMFGLGFTIGPALGGLLGGVHLRLPFFVAAGLAMVNWLYGYFVLPESLPPEKRSPFKLTHTNPFGTLRQLRVYPMVAGLAAVFVCKSLAQRGLENVWVLYTGYRYGWSQTVNGWALCLVGITAVIVQGGLVRPIVKRFGERKAVVAGTVISTLAFIGYGLASQGWMIPVIICFGALGGIAGPAIQSLVTSRVDETEQGKIQGALTSLTSLTNVFAPILFNTLLFSYFISDSAPAKIPGAPFLFGSILLAIAVLISVNVFRRFPSARQEDAPDQQEDTSTT